jgi:N-acetylglucosamine-6-phosphate deacetylase
LTAGLIHDGIHVSPALFRLLHRCLGPEWIYYTTDAMSAAGAPPGRYKLGRWEMAVGPDQIVRQPGAANLAGSALRPCDGVFRAAQMLAVSWQETWALAAQAPARFMGLASGLEPGCPANFCLLQIDRENRLRELRAVNGRDGSSHRTP